MTHGKRLPECFPSYEDGKSRRYGLLFSVNGGAFAVATLFADLNSHAVLGGLALWQLALGMIVFTIAMTVDIFVFGQHMRSTLPKQAFDTGGATLQVFGSIGKCVLFVIALLIIAGWWLAGFGSSAHAS